MNRFYWEATLNSGERLREGLHKFHMVTKENLVRLMLIGHNDTVFFDMANGVLNLNLFPIGLHLGDRDLCGRPDDFFTFKHAEFFAGPEGVGNRLIKYDIGYSRRGPDCLAKMAYAFPVMEVGGYLQLALTPDFDICRELIVTYRGAEVRVPTVLKGGQEWRIELNIR